MVVNVVIVVVVITAASAAAAAVAVYDERCKKAVKASVKSRCLQAIV